MPPEFIGTGDELMTAEKPRDVEMLVTTIDRNT